MLWAFLIERKLFCKNILSISLKNLLSKPCFNETYNLWLKQCLKCSHNASSLNLAMRPPCTPVFAAPPYMLKLSNLSVDLVTLAFLNACFIQAFYKPPAWACSGVSTPKNDTLILIYAKKTHAKFLAFEH